MYNDKYALLNDLYEYTMANGFMEAGIGDKIVSLANIAMKIRRLAGRWLDRVDRDAPPLPALPVSQVATQCAGRTSVG